MYSEKAFDKLKIDYPRTEKKGEPSFTANWLLNCNAPIAKYLREAREINKFTSTFKFIFIFIFMTIIMVFHVYVIFSDICHKMFY